MNQLKHIINPPLHRPIFLGEVLLTPYVDTPPLGAPYLWGSEILFQFESESDDPNEQLGEIVHGACRLTHMSGEPFGLMLELSEDDGTAERNIDARVSEHKDDLVFFVGKDLAEDLASYMVASYYIWLSQERNTEENQGMWLEFMDFSRYNQLFLKLCERIAKTNETSFDREAKAQEIFEYWCAQEGDFNVPGQRKWYATHGPTKDNETEADYALENEQFEALVSKGQDAVRQLVLV